MLDYIRIATVVNDIKVGETDYNADDITEKIRKAKAQKADIIVSPELAITGYTCKDLFYQNELIKSAKESLIKILKETESYNGAIVIGAPLLIDGLLFDCSIVLFSGKICGIVPCLFGEGQFSSSEALKSETVSSYSFGISEKYDIPVGSDLVFNFSDKASFSVITGENSPAFLESMLIFGGAEILINPSASCEIASVSEYRLEKLRQKSAEYLCTYAYVSAGSSESTSDSVYSGKSIVSENGNIIKENENFIDNDYIMICDTDLGKIKADRIKSKAFKNASLVFPQSVRTIYLLKNSFESKGELITIEKLPFIPSSKEKRIKRCMDIFNIQAHGLKKRIEVTNGKPVIGISGGLDSTLALLVCVYAMKLLNKHESEIIAITMPGFGTTDRTYTNSLKLMESLGVTMREISVKDACLQHFKDIGHNPDNHDITYENSQARERTQILMDIANQVNGFVVGTGDLSEVALGWCTYNGDQMSMYGVNADVPKSLIRWIIDSIISNNVFEKSSAVLADILDTPISPELLPPDTEGKITQKTEDLVGPYALHDFFIYYAVRYGFSPEKIFHLAKKAFKDDFDDETILKWLKVFYRRFFTQQFKRTASPDSVKVGSISLSPRGDFKMPSDVSAKIWLDAVEKL